MNTDHIAKTLERAWQNRDVKALAGRAASCRINTPNEWAPPRGVKPRRKLLYLSVGIPDSGTLPREALNDAMQQVMARGDDTMLRYGFGPGYYPVRKYLSDAYTAKNGFGVTPDWFQLCNGSSGAIDLVARTLIDPGDVIVTESPVYMGSLGNFVGVGADVHAVPAGGAGMDAGAMRETIQALKRAGRRVKIVYTISAFQNPTGATMGRENREALLQLAAEEGFVILEDSAYEELYYDTPPDASLFSMSRGYGVISVGTFSKTVATGLRIGWVHARPEFIGLFSRMRFDMGQNQMALHMMGRFLASGHMEPHLDNMRRLYREKMNRCADAMDRLMRGYVSFNRPCGGFYLWAGLRNGLSAGDVWRTATREGVSVNLGYSFYPESGPKKEESLRIAFSWTPLEDMDEAVLRLARAVERVARGDAAP